MPTSQHRPFSGIVHGTEGGWEVFVSLRHPCPHHSVSWSGLVPRLDHLRLIDWPILLPQDCRLLRPPSRLHLLRIKLLTFSIVSEYVPKGNLRSFMLGRRPFPWRLRLSFATDIARAIAYLHARDVGLVFSCFSSLPTLLPLHRSS